MSLILLDSDAEGKLLRKIYLRDEVTVVDDELRTAMSLFHRGLVRILDQGTYPLIFEEEESEPWAVVAC